MAPVGPSSESTAQKRLNGIDPEDTCTDIYKHLETETDDDDDGDANDDVVSTQTRLHFIPYV